MTQVGTSGSTSNATAVAPHALPSASSLLKQVELSEDLSDDPSPRLESQNGPGKHSARKRRKTTKACDDCRRRKIKCDGRQPCSSCADFNSGCSYARLPRQGRRPRLNGTDAGPSDLEELRKNLHAAESLLQKISQSIDFGTSNTAASSPRSSSRLQAAVPPAPRHGTSSNAASVEPSEEPARFITLTDAANHLDFTNTGEYDFHGLSSGAAFLRRITQHLPGLFRYDSRLPFLPQHHQSSTPRSVELPLDLAISPWQTDHGFYALPQRQLARDLCDYAFTRASCILRVVHAPSFWRLFETLYHERPQKFTLEELFVIQFLQATGNLNGCHTFIGIALRSALRMGLHRHLPHTARTPIIDETRRRVFYTIRQMDIYLAATLGLPLLLQDKDIDQAWPTEVDDEFITESGIHRSSLDERPSFLEAFNAHASLMQILAKVMDYLYPPTGADKGAANVTYKIAVAKIRELEKDLHTWHENLSSAWLPGPEKDLQITRIKILLRFAYAHVQMMLYRPFLQYYSQQGSTVETANEGCFALATAGINVCRNIVHIGLEIRKQAVLIGPYWFITYTQFFAVLSLLLYAFNNPNQPGALDIFADAKLGKDCISSLTQKSLAADRVTAALNSLFDHLPDYFKSKDRQSQDAHSVFASNPGHSQLKSQMLNPPQQHMPSSTDTQPEWSINALSMPGSALSGNSISDAPPAYMPGHAPYHIPSNVMGFPMEDPFAYPLLPGVSLGDNSFGILPEDVLQLPVFDANMSLEEQFPHLHDP
ncbi:hypothetical protein JX265_012028 [Neoarthrinium moseri]|uniref:Zn(2)-C6 fungal-type domain-containing protein n=1 Tax=Neoarthrinium moseri TaxID=1658444 RepID=A0A9P9WBL5_9PEZI|nr:hypothetical protein JX265_012028 [Neoarthrinium moseri]